MPSIEQKLDEIKTELLDLKAEIKAITVLCPIHQEKIQRLEREIYGDGEWGLKTRLIVMWTIGVLVANLIGLGLGWAFGSVLK